MGRLNEDIDDLAAEWAAKVARGQLRSDEQAALDAWTSADIRHLGAFVRAKALLVSLDQIRTSGMETLRAEIPDLPLTEVELSGRPSGKVLRFSAARPSRRIVLAGGIAASIAAVALIALPNWSHQEWQHYSTRMGEIRPITLADGSVITLNTNSKVSVGFTDHERDIRLEQGEALFKVAKNKSRPFIVGVANATVRAVGTSFAVRALSAHPIEVVVREGIVEVARKDLPAADAVRARAGTKAVVGAPIVVRPISRFELARELAWEAGRIAFQNERLADAAKEFARYNSTKIIVDPAVGNRTVTGLFFSNDPVGFANVAASALDLHVETGPGEVIIKP
jgi:transmembrane sensor